MSRTVTFLSWVASLAAIAGTGSGTLAWAKHLPDAQKDPVWITLRVYDYAHEDHSIVLAAVGVAVTILAQAGVKAHSMDCSTSRAEFDTRTDCQSPLKANDFVVRVVPNTMLSSRGPVQDAWGIAYTSDGIPGCLASVFYDRVRSFSQGARPPFPVLLGWAMAHEIGHLLLGTNSHSSSGIMRARWSSEDLTLVARAHMLFTVEESRRMKTRLAERVQSSQPEAQGQAAELGHLLLGPDSHSPRGIMRARFSPTDFARGPLGGFRFTPEQGEQIRAEVKRRVQEQGATEIVTATPAK